MRKGGPRIGIGMMHGTREDYRGERHLPGGNVEDFILKEKGNPCLGGGRGNRGKKKST